MLHMVHDTERLRTESSPLLDKALDKAAAAVAIDTARTGRSAARGARAGQREIESTPGLAVARDRDPDDGGRARLCAPAWLNQRS